MIDIFFNYNYCDIEKLIISLQLLCIGFLYPLSYNDSSIKLTFRIYTLLLVKLLQVVGGTYPNRTYVFSSPTVLWEVVARVLVFVIAPVAINILIGLKEVPQVIQV